MSKKTFRLVTLPFFVFGFFAFVYFEFHKVPKQIESDKKTVQVTKSSEISENSQLDFGQKEITQGPIQGESLAQQKESDLQVPFVIQAPIGNWKDPVFQNACEEASMLMAVGWYRGWTRISPEEAQKQILDIVAYENKTFGYNADTDAEEVQLILQKKIGLENVEVRKNFVINDIVNELQKGNIILVPAFGRALGNPYFTSPGPIAHMLVVIGYNENNHIFITNDPGTKRGANFAYDEQKLFSAIWQYPSGPGPLEPPTKENWPKAMVVIGR